MVRGGADLGAQVDLGSFVDLVAGHEGSNDLLKKEDEDEDQRIGSWLSEH